MNLWSRLFGPRSAADQALTATAAEDVAADRAIVAAPAEDPAQRREDDVISTFDAQADALRDARDNP